MLIIDLDRYEILPQIFHHPFTEFQGVFPKCIWVPLKVGQEHDKVVPIFLFLGTRLRRQIEEEIIQALQKPSKLV